MKQIIQVDAQQKKNIIELESEIEGLCRKLEHKYQFEFQQKRQQLVIELLRTKNGTNAANTDILESNYESYIEIGVEKGDEYFPNTRIPIWKCKSEWFQKIGYLTERNTVQLEKMISSLVEEMFFDVQ